MAASFGHLYKTRGFTTSPPGALLLPRVSKALEQCPRRRFLTTPPAVQSSVTPTGSKAHQRDLHTTPRLPEQSSGVKGSTAIEVEVRGHELVGASLCVHLPALSGNGHGGEGVAGGGSPRLARAKHRLRMSFVDFTQHHHNHHHNHHNHHHNHHHRNHHRHNPSHAQKRRISAHVHPAAVTSSSRHNQDPGTHKSQSQPRSLGVLSNDSFPSELNVVFDNKERLVKVIHIITIYSGISYAITMYLN